MTTFNRLPPFWQWLICMFASVIFCVAFDGCFAALTHQSRTGWDTARTVFNCLLIYNLLAVAQAKGYLSFKPEK